MSRYARGPVRPAGECVGCMSPAGLVARRRRALAWPGQPQPARRAGRVALADMAVEQTDAAWPAGPRPSSPPCGSWPCVDAATGELLAPRLDTADCLNAGSPADAVAEPSASAVLSPAGYCQLDTAPARRGRGIGRLAGDMVQPATRAGRVVLVEREPVAGATGFYRLHILERPRPAEQSPRACSPCRTARTASGCSMGPSGSRRGIRRWSSQCADRRRRFPGPHRVSSPRCSPAARAPR